jgi:hypothetical protein
VTIPLAPRTARALDLAIGERAEGPIFLAADGRRLDRHGAGRVVRRVARRAGIDKRVGPHTLRHAFITAALDAGVPLRDVQEAASHADPRTTMRYDNPRELHRMREVRVVCRVRGLSGSFLESHSTRCLASGSCSCISLDAGFRRQGVAVRGLGAVWVGVIWRAWRTWN